MASFPKDKKKAHYVEVINEKKVVRPSELGLKRVRYDYLDELVNEVRIGRKKYSKEYTLLFIPGHENKANERFYRETATNKRLTSKNKNVGIERTLRLPDDEKIYTAIAKIMNELSKMPSIKEIGIEIEEDPNIPEVHREIFQRWAIIEKLRQPMEKIIEDLYWEKMNELGKNSKHKDKSQRIDTIEFQKKSREEINALMSSDKEVMDKLGLDESKRNNPAVRSLIRLCKDNFKKKNAIFA